MSSTRFLPCSKPNPAHQATLRFQRQCRPSVRHTSKRLGKRHWNAGQLTLKVLSLRPARCWNQFASTSLTGTGATYDDSADLPKLYTLTAKQLNLSPSQHTEQLFRQILGGCQTVVEGLGAL